MKNLIFIIALLSFGCKKSSDVNPSIIGNWQITGYSNLGHTYTYPSPRPITFESDVYTVNSTRHNYEIQGNKIKIDRRYSYDYSISNNSLTIDAYVENPVTPQGDGATYMSH